jgi:hypothetical protein
MLGQEHTWIEALESAQHAKKPVRLSVNGCIILKSMLSMPQSACRAITDAVLNLDCTGLQYIAADPSGARVLETLLKACSSLFVDFLFVTSHLFCFFSSVLLMSAR